MKKPLLIAGILAASFPLAAQNADDALRYSFLNPAGTARFSSMGGAFGALGGDFGSVSTNPGGIGVYQRSEFSFTPSLFYQGTESSFNGSTAINDKYNFNFGNAGIVATWKARREESPWKSFTLGFGINRMNNFHSNITIDGQNNSSSLLDDWLQRAQGMTPDVLNPFGAQVGFNTYLIDTVPNTGGAGYFSQIPNGGVRQVRVLEREGAMGETVLAFGGNYENRLYIGASLGITYLRYEQLSRHIEETHEDSASLKLKSFYLDETLATQGSGFNLKIGGIYRFQEWLRIGAALHSPTFWSLDDSWSSSAVAIFKPDSFYASQYEAESPIGSYDYRIVTPFRAIGSIAVILAKKGIISADYEFVNYTTARISASDFTFQQENNAIRNNLKPSGNIRLGGELRLDPFALRAGVAYLGNPYRAGVNDAGTINYSLGAGLRGDGYFMDLAYVLSKASPDFYMYDRNLVSPAEIDMSSNSIMLTVGFRY